MVSKSAIEQGPSWCADLISPSEEFAGAPLLRHVYPLPEDHGQLQPAWLYISSLGIYEAYINGSADSDEVLNPGWSSYQWRLRYRSYNVVSLLEKHSVLGVALGNGRYRGRLGSAGQSALYGDRLAVISQLEMSFEDGHSELLTTDSAWNAGPSSVLANDLYDGEVKRHGP